MRYNIAIPSYKRHLLLKEKTLSYLKRTNIDLSHLTIFVADTNEEKLYSETFPKHKIVIAQKGMKNVRNFIQNYYENNEYLICIDDDISTIGEMIDKKTIKEVFDLESLIQSGFSHCKQYGSKLWGIYPVYNPFFMSDKVTNDLRYIVGCFWGCINDKQNDVSVTLDDKEDFERTIKYYLKYKSVIRLNKFAPKTQYYTQSGGMQIDRTNERVVASAKYLVKKYPLLCSLNTSKKSGKYEVKLKDKRT